MPTTPFPAGGFASVARLSPCSTRGPRLLPLLRTAFVLGLSVAGAFPAAADSPLLDVGNVATFAQGSDGEGAPWTLGDKDFTYLGGSGWTGSEFIKIQENNNPLFYSHEFLITNLSGYSGTAASPLTLRLDYKAHINGADGPGFTFRDVYLDATTAGQTVEVWKDIFASETAYEGFTTPGSGTWALYSLNGANVGTTLPGGLVDLWVIDTIKLSDGQVSTVNNTLRQQPVPEIDAASFGSVIAVLFGAFSLLERRGRRVLGMPAVA